LSVNVSTTNNPVTVTASGGGASVSVAGGSSSITVSGGIGPKGEDGAGGVSSINGAVGAVTLAVVGGTIAAAGQTITITVTPGVSSWNDLTGKPSTFSPSAHASSHAALGSDPVTLAIGQVTGLQTALDGKQASGSYVITSDSRLTDSREWSAATVTQAQAEAGTDTGRLAFTVQRVWQAIAAWWAASASKTKLDGIAAGATANQTDAHLLSRANHTGTQAVGTITGLGSLATLSAIGSITSAGAIGTAAGRVLVTDAGGAIVALNRGMGLVIEDDQLNADVPYIKTQLATVATSGAYADLSGTPAAYSLPTATSSILGGIKIGSGLTIDGSGVVTAAGTYTLPAATTSVLGGVIVGTGLSVTSGTLSVSYGTSGTTACVGNDARLSDARTPTSHTHGNISNAGAIGSTSGLPIITTTSGVLTVGAFGTSAGQFCVGNDARLSDARTPTSHTHGNISNAGAIGSTSGQVVVTTTDGVVTTATIGSGLSLSGGTLTATGGGGGGISDGNKGDITVSASGATWTINANAVTDADIASVSASKLTGTIADARHSDKYNSTVNLYLWSSFR
jgi:hypothetical protein